MIVIRIKKRSKGKTLLLLTNWTVYSLTQLVWFYTLKWN